MVDRETFDRIQQRHGRYASWAVWAEATGGVKSNIGDMWVLDSEANPKLLPMLRNDIIFVGLNISREVRPEPFGNFHDDRWKGQDYKLRYALAGTRLYGAYMTDFIKEIIEPKSGDLIGYLDANPQIELKAVERLREELKDLRADQPILLALGIKTHARMMAAGVTDICSRLIRVTHYSSRMPHEPYRKRVLAELAPILQSTGVQ